MPLPSYLISGLGVGGHQAPLELIHAGRKVAGLLRGMGADDDWLDTIEVDGAIDIRGRFRTKSADYSFADPVIVNPLEVRLARIRWLIGHHAAGGADYDSILKQFNAIELEALVVAQQRQLLEHFMSLEPDDAEQYKQLAETLTAAEAFDALKKNKAGGGKKQDKDVQEIIRKTAFDAFGAQTLLCSNWGELVDSINGSLIANTKDAMTPETIRKHVMRLCKEGSLKIPLGFAKPGRPKNQ